MALALNLLSFKRRSLDYNSFSCFGIVIDCISWFICIIFMQKVKVLKSNSQPEATWWFLFKSSKRKTLISPNTFLILNLR